MKMISLPAMHCALSRLALAALALGLSAIATASNAQSTIYACVTKSSGQVRIVPGVNACESNEYLLRWGTSGPPGPAGPPGAMGPAGPPGPASQGGSAPPSTDCPACKRKSGRE